MRSATALAALMILVRLGAPGAAWAQSGTLDPTFGSGGTVATDFARKVDLAEGVAVQDDGKIVAVGWATVAGAFRFAVARYNDDGSLDATFGSGGKVTTVFGGVEDTASAVAIQADGKIVVAGTTDFDGNLHYRFALARYNTDGTLDSSFGSGGRVTTSLFGTYNSGHAVAIQPDGKIVVAGFAGNAFIGLSDGRFGVARYNTNGSLDGAFGGSGWVTTDFGGTISNATSVAIQADGKIVVAGDSNAGVSSRPDFAVARYNQDGSHDATFGLNGDGQVTTNMFGGDDFAQAVAVDATGHIVVSGQAYGQTGVRTFALARYTPDGELDTTFDGDGKVATDFFGFGSYALAVVVNDDGIVAVGAAHTKRSRDIQFALARYSHADGSLDPTFGAGGKVTTKFSSAADVASAAALDGNADIVVAGQTQDKNFALARFRR